MYASSLKCRLLLRFPGISAPARQPSVLHPQPRCPALRHASDLANRIYWTASEQTTGEEDNTFSRKSTELSQSENRPVRGSASTSNRGRFSLSKKQLKRITFSYRTGKPYVTGDGSGIPSLALKLHEAYRNNGQRFSPDFFWIVNSQLTRWAKDDKASQDVQDALKIHTAQSTFWLNLPLHRQQWKWFTSSWRATHNKLSRLLGCLLTSASSTLYTLEFTPRLPLYIEADSLYYLRYAHWEEIQSSQENQRLFWFHVDRLRQLRDWEGQIILDRHLELMLQNLPESEHRALIELYLELYPSPGDTTLLLLVDRYTKMKDVDAALSLLRRVSPRLLQQNHEDTSKPRFAPVARRCTNLLTLESIHHDGQSQSFQILPQILELGIPPNTIMYNLIVRNAVRLGLPAVARDIFQYAREQGMQIDSITHLMLLKDAFQQHDTDFVSEMLSIIQERPDLCQDRTISGYMMHIVRSVCQQRGLGPDESWQRMLNVYDHTYSRLALFSAGIIRDEQIGSGNETLKEPSPDTLAFTIFCFVMVQRDEAVVNTLWTHLRGKLDDGDEMIQEAARHSVFFSGFIVFYGRMMAALPKALGILQSVLQNDWCVPDDIVWSIAVAMFLKHGKIEPAQRIWQTRLGKETPLSPKAWQYHLANSARNEVGQQIREYLDVPWDLKDTREEMDRYATDEARFDDHENAIDQPISEADVPGPELPATGGTWIPWKWETEGDLQSVINLAEAKSEDLLGPGDNTVRQIA